MNIKNVTSRESRVSSPAAAQAQLALRSPLSAFRSPRSGILLLVVLSMLTLFLLIGTAFIVSANQYRKANKILAKVTESSNSSVDQVNLLEEVLNQLVRDTNNQNSSLRFHSLLRDMYGNDGLLAEIDVVEWATAFEWDTIQPGDNTNVTQGQLLQFHLNPTTITDQFGISLTTLSANSNAYNGLVLTFLDGPARGQSVRIVGHSPIAFGTAFNAALRVLSPRLANGSTITTPSNLNGSRILINGRPFNGTGVGYNPLAAANTAKLSTPENVLGTNRLLSLMPNNAFQSLLFDTDHFDDQEVADLRANIFDNYYFTNTRMFDLGIDDLTSRQQNLEAIRLKNLLGTPGQGGSDESYDAVDFQNMVLALMQTNPVETVLPDITVPGYPQSLGQMVIPSNHRPALLRYWKQQLAGGTLKLEYEPNLLRKVLLRPSWLDHPNFTGSNPDFANALSLSSEDALRRMIYGPWDVDNDNDGIRDSVWVDFGAPVMENADGRLVKPMAAIMVLDMGGRLNLNAHGSEDIAGMNGNPTAQTLAGGTQSSVLPHGQGYGTAEISLGPLMPYDNSAGAISRRAQQWKWYKRFSRGIIRGRPIVPDVMNVADFQSTTPDPRQHFMRRQIGKLGQDNGTTFVPGDTGFDISAQLKMQGVPRLANGKVADITGNLVLGGYASMPDYRGRYAVGLNDFGQPVHEALAPGDFDSNGNAIRQNENTPYELDLSLGAARGDSSSAPDGPYTMAEIERVLRAYDPDSGAMPSRIWDLAGEFKDSSSDTTPNLTTLNLWRTTLTTDSYDLPVPSVVVPGWMRVGRDGTANTKDDYARRMGKPAVGATFADLIEYRLRDELDIDTNVAAATTAQLNTIRQQMAKLLPPDLADGLRLDINRPLGNGRDDNDNGVVDEPGEWDDTDNNGVFDSDETEAAYWASSAPQLNSFTGNYGIFRDERILLEDRNNDNVSDAADLTMIDITGVVDAPAELVTVHNLRRQMLARDLYVLAMTLVDPFDMTTTDGKAKTRQLAQWAINVVDYRDPDNIMTAFEYDENPFDGWAPDGNLATTNDIYGADNKIGGAAGTTNADQGGLVWGLERPELLITETLAWHDRRTEDHVDEDISETHNEAASVEDSQHPDPDFDQKLAPRGAGFIELYNPWPANPATNADTHRINSATNKDLGVDLARTHTGDPGNPGSPVWRIAVYRNARTKVGAGGAVTPPQYLEPGQAVLLDPDSPKQNERPNMVDRCIYFCGFEPDGVSRPSGQWDDDGVAFYEGAGTQDMVMMRSSMPSDQQAGPVVRPGRYMVIGAGEKTGGVYKSPIGDLTKKAKPPGAAGPEPWSMVMRPNDSANPFEFRVDPLSGPIGYNAKKHLDDGTRAICDIAVMNKYGKEIARSPLPASSGGNRRFTFSEPVSTKTSKRYRALIGVPLDVPFDNNREDDLNGELERLDFAPGFRWVYLQRLANPLLPWNPERLMPNGLTTNPKHDATLAVNPYFTVDTSPVNLTVFNGRSDIKFRVKAGGTGPLGDEVINGQIFKNNDAYIGFASVERGQKNDPIEGSKHIANSGKARGTVQVAVDNPWNQENPGYTRDGKQEAAAGGSRHRFSRAPDSTIGFLNSAFSQTLPSGGTADVTPDQPFPWLAWNNRPYANAAELMQVPNVHSSKLLRAFSMKSTGSNATYYSGSTKSKLPDVATDGVYRHQQNFFRTDNLNSTGTALASSDSGIAGMFRILDYIHVPSPFVKTETWLNPTSFGNTNVTNVDDPRYLRQPPFNRIAQYREPGRVNINTVVNGDVWDGGLLHRERFTPADPWNPATNNYDPDTGHSGPRLFSNAATVSGVVASRRGYGAANTSLLLLEKDTPTFFENPFRSADAFDLVPVPEMLQDNSTTPTNRKSVSATVLRQDELSTAPNKPPLFASTSTDTYNDADRNAYFRMQPMTRLSSMTTNRSNVYAVWVTVGFFEVENAPSIGTFIANNSLTAGATANALYKKVYPDGYAFGKEAGSDTGDIRRVREFAMIDRTVPVAFEPGKNHNVDKAIRLRRRIE